MVDDNSNIKSEADASTSVSVALSATTASTLVKGWPDADFSWLQPTASASCPFPLELLPPHFCEMVRSFADARKVPTDFVVAALLGGGAAAIGNRLRLRTFEGSAEPICVFLAAVAPPATGKSRALDIAESPLTRIETALNEAYEAVIDQSKARGQLSTLASALRASVAKSLAMEGIETSTETEGYSDGPPAMMITDWTVAGVIKELQHGIEGRTIIADELTGALANTVGASGLKSRALILQGFDGKPYRKLTSDGRVFVPALHLSVLGGTQPERVSALIGNVRDGLVSRILWFMPDTSLIRDLPSGSGPGEELEQALMRLVQIEPARNSNCYSHQVPLIENARVPLHGALMRWRDLQQKSDGAFEDFIARALQQALRLSTLLAQIEHALDKNDGPIASIGAAEIERGIALMDTYFLPMAENVLGIAQTPTESDAYQLAKYLRRLGKLQVSVRDDIYRGRGSPVREKSRVGVALEELRQRGIVRDIVQSMANVGRPSFTIEVHPHLLKTDAFDR